MRITTPFEVDTTTYGALLFCDR